MIKKPRGWRTGQTLFNFFEWLNNEKNYAPNQSYRMADTFHISDTEFEKLYAEFLTLHE